MAKNITPRKQNYSRWYQDVIAAAELADHAPVKGCMVIRPEGYALWERMQAELDRQFKLGGHRNAYFPLLIPRSFIQREAEHIEGFAPELAVVTHAGGKELEESLVVRPTSETVIGHMYAQWVQSYRDLPLLINQWCNVMRWELRTRLFLRTSEFLWQEGHTAHETETEAEAETLQILEIYRRFQEDFLALPVFVGKKSESEKFPGALRTYCVEGMMQDGKALQLGTSHNLGQNFARAFDIRYLDRENQHRYAHTTSWGTSTRMIGGLLMTHADDDGLLLPPRIAPRQVVIVPLFPKDADREAVTAFAAKAQEVLADVLDPLRIVMDTRYDWRPAERFFRWIQRGVPLRLEIGPRDVRGGSVTVVRRDTREKRVIPLTQLQASIPALLEQQQQDIFQRALTARRARTHRIDDYATFREILESNEGGFIEAHWNGSATVEAQIKAETKATIRCIPFADDPKTPPEPGRCILSGEPSPQRVIFAQAY